MYKKMFGSLQMPEASWEFASSYIAHCFELVEQAHTPLPITALLARWAEK